jgi:hypothetical protein
MKYINVIALVLSGAIILGSVLLSEIGFKRSILSRKIAALLTGTGIGLASGMIVYWGFGNGDLFGSIVTSLIAAVIAGTMKYFSLGKWSS